MRISSGSPPSLSRSTYAPRSIASSGTAAGSHTGRPWRESASAVGRSVWRNACRQASAVSLKPAGRTTSRFGVARSVTSCSIGWWVGPSSPTPIESCVNTNVDGIRMIAASRIDPFM